MRIGPQRPVNPEAIVAPQGYRVEALITGLSFPSALSFGPGGELYLAEGGGVAGSVVSVPRVLRIDPDASINEIGRLENPILGLLYRNGELLIGEDGPSPRILRVTAEGEVQVVIEGLPGGGDYGLSGFALDQSGSLLFGLGTRTNSGVVGLDNTARRWVPAHADWADVPGADVQLAGVNYVTTQPSPGGTARVTTGSFKPFGHRCEAGDMVRGAQRCGGAVYRIGAEGGDPERLAWGLRNPIGLAVTSDGRILATEGGMEERGSRPVAGAPDNLWEVQPGGYHGWPDHASGLPVTDARFRLPGYPQPRRLLAGAPKVSATPLATFPSRSGVGRLDVSTSDDFGFTGDVLVALSGEWSPAAYAGEDSGPLGRRVVRVNPKTGETADFLVNRSSSGDSFGGFERPFEVRFDPTGEVLYVLDLGQVYLDRDYGLQPFGGTGVVWRITRIRPMTQAPAVERRGGAEASVPSAEFQDAAATDAYESLPLTDEGEDTAESGRPDVSPEDLDLSEADETSDVAEAVARNPVYEEAAAVEGFGDWEAPGAEAPPHPEESAAVAGATPEAPGEEPQGLAEPVADDSTVVTPDGPTDVTAEEAPTAEETAEREAADSEPTPPAEPNE